MGILFQSLKYNVLRNDLQSLKSSVELLTKSVSAIVAKVISPQTEIPTSFISNYATVTSESTPTTSTMVSSPSTSSITSRTVTAGSDLEIPDNSQPSPVDSTHVTSWLSSVPPMTPSSDSSETEAYSTTSTSDLLTSEEIKEALRKSTSRRNFATNLSRALFDERTRVASKLMYLAEIKGN